MRSQLIPCLMLLVASAPLPAHAAGLNNTPLPGMPDQQTPGPEEGHGKSNSGQSPNAPGPNPDASGKYHVGDGVSPPKLFYAPDPEYTEQARRKRLQGKIVLSLTVDNDGKSQDVRVLHSLAETVDRKFRAAAISLDESAVKVVQQYRFDPAVFLGKPVPVKTTVEVDFRLY